MTTNVGLLQLYRYTVRSVRTCRQRFKRLACTYVRIRERRGTRETEDERVRGPLSRATRAHRSFSNELTDPDLTRTIVTTTYARRDLHHNRNEDFVRGSHAHRYCCTRAPNNVMAMMTMRTVSPPNERDRGGPRVSR